MVRQVAAFFVVASALLLLRNLALDSPLMPGDEYVYLSAAQTFPDSSQRLASDPYLPRIHSPVFAAYGRLLFALTARPELLLKALNTLAFVATALIYLSLLGAVRGPGRHSLAAALLLITPISAYTAYFMPESTYGLFFAVLAAIVVILFPARLIAGAAAAGAVVGTMLLIKPHAVALAAAVTLTLLSQFAAPRHLRPRPASLGVSLIVFLSSCYGTEVVLNAALMRQLQFDPLLFVGPVYQRSLAAGAAPLEWLRNTRELASIFGGHAIVLGALLAPAIAAAAAHVRRLYADSLQPRQTREARLWLLICFAVFAALTTVAMTAVFTSVVVRTFPHAHLRLQGRYYSFFLSLYFLIFFAAPGRNAAEDGARKWDWVRFGGIAGVCAAVLLVFVHSRRTIYPFDFPEAFIFTSWQGLPGDTAQQARALFSYLAIAATALAYLLLAWRGQRARVIYPALLTALFAFDNVAVSRWQFKSSGDNLALRADARAAAERLAVPGRDRGVVIGPEWNGPLAYYLFNFRSSPRVLVRSADTVLTRADVPADARWMLTVGHYRADFPLTAAWQTSQIACFDLSGDARAPHGE
jgi:phosphoglycerol transferase